MNVAILSTGLANLASVEAALRRVGAEPVRTEDPRVVRDATHVVLPGVGAFGPGMRGLRARALDEALRERIARDRPLLGICLGMQMLCRSSEEAPGVAGLGTIPIGVRRHSAAQRLPHLSWARVGASWLPGGWAYFAHSYAVQEAPEGWEPAFATYGSPFVAALRRGAVLACQFHPELSGAWGLSLLSRWVRS